MRKTDWEQLAHLKFSTAEFSRAFAKLKNTASGPDYVTKRMFPTTPRNKEKLLHAMNMVVFSSEPLHETFTKSRTKIIPQKRGLKQRPLSIISKISGLLELMIIGRVEPAVKSYFEGRRFGFLTELGTEDFLSSLFEAKDKMSQAGVKAGVLSVDLRGAFNSVSHGRLILKTYDILRSSHYTHSEVYILTNFVSRWLQNRLTRLENSTQTVKVVRGTPQGAPLSALLFVIYFDFDGTTIGVFIAYADDGSLIIYAKTWDEFRDKVLVACYLFDEWCRADEMQIALDKSWLLPLGNHKKIPNQLTNLPVKTVTSAKLLGIVIDQRLNFRLQIIECEKFWYFRLKILRVLMFLGLSFRKGLQIAYNFRSKLTYGLLWWLHISDTSKNRLCQLWRIAVRTVARLHPSSPTKDFSNALSIPTLDQFATFLLTKRKFANKFLTPPKNDVQPPKIHHNYNLRARKQPDCQQENWLQHESDQLLQWLVKKAKAEPKKSPTEMLRRKMFGLRPHPDSDISELVRMTNELNSFYKDSQKSPNLTSP